jgi:hypothetical protein
MLEAYALAALEDDEWEDVDLHLAACPQCSLEVAQVQRATYLLSETVPRWEPPPGLRDRVMASLPAGGAETAPASGAAGLFDRIRGFATLSRLTRVLLPLAATLVLGLLTGAMFMNMVNTTEGTENAATEVAQISGEAATEAGEDLPLRSAIPSAGLLHFDPSTPPLVLHPPHGPDGRHGFMLIAEDGRRAMLMISGMEAPDPSWIYNVWLTRNGHRISLGPVQIDASGLATIEVVPPEPLFLFDAINVTMDKDTQEPGSPGQMILESKLAGRP